MLPRRTFRRLDRARLDARVLAVQRPRFERDLARLADSHRAYAAGGRVVALASACHALLGGLDQAFDLPTKRVFVRDSPRPHKRRGGKLVWELHGQCDPAGPLEVYTRTAARAQPVALKTLLDTLLHEWVHHFDFCSEGDSVHCAGFYERVGQLYVPARDWLDGPGADPGAGTPPAADDGWRPTPDTLPPW